MISLKMYMDKDDSAVAVMSQESNDLLAAVMDSYRSALRAIGRSAVKACPEPGRDLEQALVALETRLFDRVDPKIVNQTQDKVERQLDQWGSLTADHLKRKTNDVKELLILLAGTAKSVGERDQRYTNQIGGLTAELKAIATLDDLSLIRSSLVSKANQLKNYVDQMAHDGQQSMAQLQSKVSGYETKLKAIEILASRDTVTGLANRRSVERRMEWNIEQNQTFCVVILDLNGFKQVNDKHGHLAGDNLLKDFSEELQNNVRSEDMVGRWGGDEFIVVVGRDLAGAKTQVERIQEWVFGNYTIKTGTAKEDLKVYVTGSIGMAQWVPGKSMQQVMEQADAAMYLDKKEFRKAKS